MILRSQFNLAIHFRRQAQFAVYDKELHASMPLMQSAEYQATIPQKFPIIVHNCANV